LIVKSWIIVSIVVRQIPKALQLSQRLSLTVLPFEQKGEVLQASLSFQENLTNALVDLDRFRIVEREKLDVILQEQKFSQSQLVERATALKLGKLVAARSVVTGSIVSSLKGTEIVARLIDTETTEILAVVDVYDEVIDLSAIMELAKGMAIKFQRQFPLLSGYVVQVKGKAVFTDLGEGKTKLQRRLVVYREEPVKHPVTGKVLGADNVILGHVRVTQVMPDLSKAEIVNFKPEDIKKLDRVITE